LLEVLTAVALMGALMAIAVGGWSAWSKASAQSGAAREIQSAMRQAQQRAVTEGKATCVWFSDSADTYSVYSGSCSDTAKTLVSGPREVAANVRIDSPQFTLSTGISAGVTFQARGTGSPGDVTVRRNGSSKTYTLAVDWLTGRVSLA
jgi:type II secretory pathway pseudopilin PulG